MNQNRLFFSATPILAWKLITVEILMVKQAHGATQLTAKKDLRCVEFLIVLVGQHFITLLLLLLSLFLSNKFVHTK